MFAPRLRSRDVTKRFEKRRKDDAHAQQDAVLRGEVPTVRRNKRTADQNDFLPFAFETASKMSEAGAPFDAFTLPLVFQMVVNDHRHEFELPVYWVLSVLRQFGSSYRAASSGKSGQYSEEAKKKTTCAFAM